MSFKQLKDLNVDVEVLNKSALNHLSGGQEDPEKVGGPDAGDPDSGGPSSDNTVRPCCCGCICIVV